MEALHYPTVTIVPAGHHEITYFCGRRPQKLIVAIGHNTWEVLEKLFAIGRSPQQFKIHKNFKNGHRTDYPQHLLQFNSFDNIYYLVEK